MMLIDLAKFDELSAQDCVPPCCDESEAMRRKVAQIGLDLDEPGRRLIEDLLEAAANAEQRIAEQRARIRYLENLSITDELTGVLNRRGFKLELERALARAERRGETGVLLLGDLNRFKAINDSLGHLAGDSVLRAVAHELRRSTRRSDYVARIGGDEFAVLMTDAHREEAKVPRGIRRQQRPGGSDRHGRPRPLHGQGAVPAQGRLTADAHATAGRPYGPRKGRRLNSAP
jgi:GGDEF domain-containing protein